MSVRQDVINLIVNVNGNDAQNQLNELKKRAADISFEMNNLKKNTQEYADKKLELRLIGAEMDNLKQKIGISALSQKELTAELNKLKSLRGSTIPFTKEYKDFSNQIKEVENRLYDVRNGVQGFASFFSKIKDEIKQFGALAVGYLGFEFLGSQFTNIVQGAGKLSDQLADLRRVSGLTEAEANKLNSSLSKIDTRTAVGSLRDIAIIAGKLGVAKGDILGFTEATDKLVVSLGDELGNADQITTSLGKILNVFDGKVDGDNITRLGNAFVELANTGAATGGFIAEFDQRLASQAKQAGISVGALSGLAAGIEELGGKTESSSSAFAKLLGTISADIPKAAKIAGIGTDAFRKLFSENAIEGALKYSEALVKNQGSFEAVTKSLQGAGEDGIRTISLISTLGEKADFLRGRVDLGVESNKRAAAITDSFALKNETFGASLEKLGKQFNSLVNSPGITSFLKGAVDNVSSFIKLLTFIPTGLIKMIFYFGAAAVGVALFNSGMIQSAILSLRQAAATIVATAAGYAYATALTVSRLATSAATASHAAYIVISNLFTGSINLATAATRLFSIAVKTGLGPIGLLIAVVGAAIVGINSLSDSFKSSTKEFGFLTETMKEANAETAKQKSEIAGLTAVIKDNVISTETKRKALSDLIAISPEYLSRLTLENIATSEGKKILDQFNISLDVNARLKAAAIIKDREFAKSTNLDVIKQELEIAQKLGKGYGDLSDDAQAAFSKIATSVGRTSLTSSLLNTVPSKADFADAFKGLQTEINNQNQYYAASTDNFITKTKEKENARRTFLLREITDLRTQENNIKKINGDQSKEFETAAKKTNEARAKFNAEFNKSSIDKKIDGGGGGAAGPTADEIKQAASEKKRREKEAQDKLEQLRKEAAAFAAELKKLRANAEAGTLSEDEKEKALIQEKFTELLTKARKYWAENTDLGRKATEDIIAIRNAQLEALYKKIFERNSKEEYQNSLNALDAFLDQQKVKAEENYVAGKITKQQYEDAIADIELRSAQSRVQIATDYSGTVKKAEEDLTKFKRVELDKQVADAIAAAERRKKDSVNDLLAEAKLRVLITPKGSDARLEAEKNYLKTKYDLTEKNEADTVKMRELKELELADAIKELDRQAFVDKIDNVVKYVELFQQALQSLNTIISNKENKELQRDKQNNDKKKSNFKNQLDNKLISQAQYEKNIDKINREQEQKEKELKVRQAKREKALSIFSILINTASAIMQTYAKFGFPMGTPFAIAQGVLGALQIAAVVSAPQPELGRGGHLANGPKHSHSSGGLHVVNPLTGRTEMLLEQNEAVINSAAMNSSRVMTITGTGKQIASAVNTSTGGVAFANGAQVSTSWYNKRPATINPAIVRSMAQGGIISNALKDESASYSEASLRALNMVAAQMEAVRDDFKSFPTNLTATVVYKDLQKKEQDFNAAKAASGF